MSKASDRQVGGDHYKHFAIQPAKFLFANNVGFIEGEIIKRVMCWRLPSSDGIEELRKAAHEIELLIEFVEELEKEANHARKNKHKRP